MKLSSPQLRSVEKQLGVKAVPEEHPIASNLTEAFSDHSFFLDAAGLNIVESTPLPDGSNGNVVKLASWTSDERTELRAHEPEVLRVSVTLESEEQDPRHLSGFNCLRGFR